MKTIKRRWARLTLVLCIALLSGAILVIPGSRPTLAQEGKEQAKPSQPEQPLAAVTTAFTYQGQLKIGANRANGHYDFTFKLFNAASAGSQVGSTITSANLAVSDGLFSVTLDFGAAALSGEARWLQVAVRPAGGGGYTTLNPRQALTATPYALSLRADSTIGGSGAQVLTVVNNNSGGTGPNAATAGGIGVRGVSNSMNGTGVLGQANNGALAHGVAGDSADGIGVYGSSTNFEGVHGETASNYPGVFGKNNNTSYEAPGVRGDAVAGPGVYGFSEDSNGVSGLSNGVGDAGVYGNAPNGFGLRGDSASNAQAGVFGRSTAASGYGVVGDSPNWYGVGGSGASGVYGLASAASGHGVDGKATGGPDARGVMGESSSGWGVYGLATSGIGVRGKSDGGAGVYGESANTGVAGYSSGNSGFGVYGNAANGFGVRGEGFTGIFGKGGTFAAQFQGDVLVTGDCDGCLGPSQLDDPLDPANKYLYHAVVESPDMLNVYNGNVTTDASGEAVVTMPAYFEALNKDFRYQLTVLGQFAQAIIATEIKDNRFTIKTDKPNVKVSWLVTGVRNDPYSQAQQQPVEVDKQGAERGKYLHPKEYGQPENQGIKYVPEQGTPSK